MEAKKKKSRTEESIEVKNYKSVEEAVAAKNESAKEFLTTIDMVKLRSQLAKNKPIATT